MDLRVGDVVEVRDEAEILATLDERGELDGLPFMPEMAAYCGRRLTVHKVAHKLCDTQTRTGLRKMERAVHLTGARCDGSAHGGCQTACSMYWKEAWIRRVDGAPSEAAPTRPAPGSRLLPLLEVNTRRPDRPEHYSCQATELLRAAPACVPLKDVAQYAKDVRSGNVGLRRTVQGIAIGLFNRLQNVAKRALPRRLWIKGGLPWGFLRGRVTGPTPTEILDLRPGELVRIKPKEEILRTLNTDLLNRGMGFEQEMARHCGKTRRVRARVDRCIDERTGRMLHMKNPCIVLDDVVCEGVHSLNCPREFVPFWREIWLERVG